MINYNKFRSTLNLILSYVDLPDNIAYRFYKELESVNSIEDINIEIINHLNVIKENIKDIENRKEQCNTIADYVITNCPRFVKEKTRDLTLPLKDHINDWFNSNSKLQKEDKYIVQAGFLALFLEN